MNSEEFEKYQVFTEKTINNLSHQVTILEKKLDMFTNLLEISKYINQYIKDPNLASWINDMLIGVFGAKHSTIFIKLDDEFIDAVSQNGNYHVTEGERELILKYHEEEFILNSEKPIFRDEKGHDDIHSCIGVPVKVEDRLIAYIMIQHNEMNYFTKEHAVFLSLIGNHIGVAIENNFLYKKVKESAYRDGLTEIFNKRYFFETLNHISNLEEQNYSIVMIDLDNFKGINDTYGHPMGDLALRTVAQIIQNATRANDIVARYGGDEIIIYMQNFTDKERVRRRIENIRKEIERAVMTLDDTSISITASFGVYIKCNERLTLDEVIKKADDALYLSKQEGKNKVSVS